MPTRTELIADWERQLAAAEAVSVATPRAAWLARVRARLYRFLLACYGRGDWTADYSDRPARSNSPRVPSQPGQRYCEVDFSGSLELIGDLSGKPAKTPAHIRSVLKKVARAQEDSLPAGPLARGLDPAGWVIVAAASSKLKTGRCQRLLKRAGLHPRLRYRGDDHMVEVPAHERHEAFALLKSHRPELHAPPNTPRTQPVPLWFTVGNVLIALLWFTFLSAWMIVDAAAWPTIVNIPLANCLTSSEFSRVWGSLFVVTVLFALLQVLRIQSRRRLLARRA